MTVYTFIYVSFSILDDPNIKVNSVLTVSTEQKVNSKRCAGMHNYFKQIQVLHTCRRKQKQNSQLKRK